MSQWLYNSEGKPIAFISGEDNVFSKSGSFLGKLYENELWHGAYMGQIVKGHLLLTKQGKSSVRRAIPAIPASPGIPAIPATRGAVALPTGYIDIKL